MFLFTWCFVYKSFMITSLQQKHKQFYSLCRSKEIRMPRRSLFARHSRWAQQTLYWNIRKAARFVRSGTDLTDGYCFTIHWIFSWLLKKFNFETILNLFKEQSAYKTCFDEAKINTNCQKILETLPENDSTDKVCQ